MDTVQLIIDALDEFGLSNINEDTTVFVNKEDYSDVEVADSEFGAFTKAHATCASYLVDFDNPSGDLPIINVKAVTEFVDQYCKH